MIMDKDATTSPFADKLHILVVEDSEADAILTMEKLRFGNWDVDWQRVEKEEDFLNALESIPDLIISDHSMPQFASTRALELLQKRKLDIPFIIVSGEISTEAAVGMMKAGAQDYLLKDDLARLLPVVQRELREAEIRRQRRIAQENMRKLSNVVEQSTNSIFITNPEGIIEYVNPAFEKITGYKKDEVLGKKPGILQSGKHDAEFYRNMWDRILHEKTFHEIFINRKKDGKIFYEEKTIFPLKDNIGKVTHFISTGTDITEKLQTEERLEYLLYYDSVTELPNRMELMNRLEYALLHANPDTEKIAILFLNIDRFNVINDTLGREIGDYVLQMQVQRIKRCLHENSTLARVASNEFSILLLQIKSVDEVTHIIEEILRSLAFPVTICDHEFYLTGSIGAAVYPEDADDSIRLLRCADVALHRAKDQGGNTYKFYAPDMGRKAIDKLNLESQLRRAITNEEFTLYYQPKVDLNKGSISGVEALLRWIHPEKGLIPPDHFIPLLEETGLIMSVGDWVIRHACAQANKWQSMFKQPISIAVNLSAKQFNYPNLAERVVEIIEENHISPSLIEVEITESTVMQNAERAIEMLRKLKNAGMKIAVDDFGTGYSSLAYLKRFPVDSLKVDRSFVQDIIFDPDAFSIAKSIIVLAHSLNLDVIAEGIETDSQLRMLQLLKCDCVQGYYFSKPMDADKTTAFLDANKYLSLPDAISKDGSHALLLVDDDEHTLAVLKQTMDEDEYNILIAKSGEEAMELLGKQEIGVIISDHRMLGMNGTQFLKRVRKLYPESIRMILSGFSDMELLTEAINEGYIYKFIKKPWDPEFLRASVREAFKAYNVRHEPHI